MNVVRPTTRSNASMSAATARKSGPKDIAWATRARATKDIDRKVRNMPARTNASLYARDRADNRLQCSVLKIWITRGSYIDAIGMTGVGGCGRSGDIGRYLLLLEWGAQFRGARIVRSS